MIFLDYQGIIDRTSGVPHRGAKVLCADHPHQLGLILLPGAQGVDRVVWDKIRSIRSIGWDPKKKEYGGYLFAEGQLRELPSVDGKVVDWAAVDRASLLGEEGLINRTNHPAQLESLRQYALKGGSSVRASTWETILRAVTEQLDDVTTGFDGEKSDVATAQARIQQVMNG